MQTAADEARATLTLGTLVCNDHQIMDACNLHSAETTDVLRGALLSVTSLVLLVTIHALPSLLHMVGVLVYFVPGAWQVDGAQNPTVGRGSVQDGDAAVTECCKVFVQQLSANRCALRLIYATNCQHATVAVECTQCWQRF